MRVSFINPPIFPYRKIMRNFDCATESKGNYLYQPYDFLLLSARLPASWSLHFCDAIALKINEEECLKQISNFKPDIIVCAVAATNWQQDLNFVKTLREEFPKSTLYVFGDILIEKGPAEIIQKFVNGILTSPVIIDFEVPQEGLRSDEFYERVNLKAPQKIELKNIRHDTFIHKAYRWPFARYYQYTTIFTAWGCPYSCSYCIMSKFPNYWRDSQEIIEEMEQVKKLGIREIYIGDRSFGLPYNNVVALLDKMIEKKFHFSWSTYFHPNQYRPELLDKMKQSGCHTIIIGIESKDQTSLKDYSRHVRQDQMSSLLEHAKRIGIEVCGDFIIGLPHDDRKSVEETIRYSQKIGIDFASFNVATPLAGSDIRKLAISMGKMKEDDQFDSLGKNAVVSVSNLSEEEIIELRNSAVQGFYARPSYILKRVFKIRGYQHFMIQFQEAIQILLKANILGLQSLLLLREKIKNK
ncbi:MAG TPA: radical SAM protein [Bacteriovoracaceae bacterium]|nr:radical SAM protein [Bacteriovoracaceae bacterium]